MGLRILHSADWHMDSPFASFPEETRNALRRQQLRLPEKIAQLCSMKKCDLVVLAGDVFDGIPSRESIAAVKTALAQCAVPVFVSPGNHDFCGMGSPWLEEVWPENVHIFTGGMESVIIPELDCRIYGAGYQSMDCPGLLEHFQAEGEQRYCVGVLHGDPVTAQSPYCPVTTAQIRESGLDYLALGHIHRSGQLRAGDTVCGWPGCPMGRGWDETGEKGILLVTLEDGVRAEFLPLDMPRFVDLQIDVGMDPVNALDRVLPAGGNGDFYRITLTGWGDADLAALKNHFSRFPNLTLRDRTEAIEDLWGRQGEDTLMGVYFRMLREMARSDPRAELAAQISHRLLSGGEVPLP